MSIKISMPEGFELYVEAESYEHILDDNKKPQLRFINPPQSENDEIEDVAFITFPQNHIVTSVPCNQGFELYITKEV